MKIIFILLSVLILSACTSEELTYTVEEVDGVRYVHNLAPKWGEQQKLSLEFVQQIGDLNTADENYQFFRPTDIDVDSKGNIYVMDSGNSRIQKFSTAGKYLATIGNKGEGPGEFTRAFHLEITPDDRIYVTDVNGGKVSIFDDNGKFVRVLKPGLGPYKFNLLSSGKIVMQVLSTLGHHIPDGGTLLTLLDNEGTKIKEFGKPKVHEDRTFIMNGNNSQMTIDKEDNIYLTFTRQNRIEKYSPEGKLLLKIDRVKNFIESETNSRRELSKSDGKTVTISDVNQFSSGIAVDSKDKIWVPSHTRQLTDEEKVNGISSKISIIEIYDSEGVLLQNMSTDNLESLGLIHIINGRLFFLSIGNAAVYEYKIVENQSN